MISTVDQWTGDYSVSLFHKVFTVALFFIARTDDVRNTV